MVCIITVLCTYTHSKFKMKLKSLIFLYCDAHQLNLIIGVHIIFQNQYLLYEIIKF